MSHWAQIDENNIVVNVLACEDDDKKAYDFLINSLGGKWLKTSYNTLSGEHRLGGIPFRKNYAGIGYVYDKERDAFIPPKPFFSWVLNEETCQWEPPFPPPEDGKPYVWDEYLVDWVEVEIPKEDS